MKELTIISGKGGTGKTTVSAAFAALATNRVLADCDVDAADLHLVLEPVLRSRHDFSAMRTPRIDPERCTGCGDCASYCRFDAISQHGTTFVVDGLACEHCGLCALVCPTSAIVMEDTVSGEWLISDTPHGPLVHARLGIGEDNSGKLVTLVRREARRLAEQTGATLLINDGPPGIGCPVTAALTGVDQVLVVTEPTLSGIHDMQRVAALCAHFRIPLMVCINKYDLNRANCAQLRAWCAAHEIEVVGEIPFDPAVTRALVARRSIIAVDCGAVTVAVRQLWDNVLARLTAA
ncbi:(4Fe-4S)-binding protein [Chromatium okenii]|uniref:ATP-binding protein n=1 Tax=Chromatium okenii TaxID=61644 RepID=UPI001905D02A|nr:ATP-binding protein [Chromatium okenii]MBK1642086.1 (4Fe-4S)-binding protein [Chromatium okenii]